MPTGTQALSDKALSILVFAAYHGLANGERVSSIVRRDDHGHAADADGLAELEAQGLVTADADRITLSEAAQALVETFVAAMRRDVGR